MVVTAFMLTVATTDHQLFNYKSVQISEAYIQSFIETLGLLVNVSYVGSILLLAIHYCKSYYTMLEYYKLLACIYYAIFVTVCMLRNCYLSSKMLQCTGDQICEKGSYSLSDCMHLTIHNLTCEYGTVGHIVHVRFPYGNTNSVN